METRRSIISVHTYKYKLSVAFNLCKISCVLSKASSLGSPHHHHDHHNLIRGMMFSGIISLLILLVWCHSTPRYSYAYISSNSIFWYAILSKYELFEEDESILECLRLLPVTLVALPQVFVLLLLDCSSSAGI